MRSSVVAAACVAAILALPVGGCQTTGTTKTITQQQSMLAFDESARIITQPPVRENHATSEIQVESYLWPGGGIFYVEAFPGRLFRVAYSEARGLEHLLENRFQILKLAVAGDVAFAKNGFGRAPYAVGQRPNGETCFVFSQTLRFAMDDAMTNFNPAQIYAYGWHCAPPYARKPEEIKAEMLKVVESLRDNR